MSLLRYLKRVLRPALFLLAVLGVLALMLCLANEQTIKRNCHTRIQYMTPLPTAGEISAPYIVEPIEVEVGGAVVFVLDVESLIRC